MDFSHEVLLINGVCKRLQNMSYMIFCKLLLTYDVSTRIYYSLKIWQIDMILLHVSEYLNMTYTYCVLYIIKTGFSLQTFRFRKILEEYTTGRIRNEIFIGVQLKTTSNKPRTLSASHRNWFAHLNYVCWT